MKCAEFESRINELLDERQRLDADAAVSEHAAACAPCRKTLAGYETLCDGVDLFETPALGRTFSETVVAASLVEPAPPRRWLTLRTGLGALAAVAALLVLALLPRIFSRSNDPNRTAHNPPQNQPGLATIQAGPRHRPEPKLVAPEPKAPSPSESPAPSVAATNGSPAVSAAEEMQQYRQFMENITPQLPNEPPLWMDHLAGGIRPVANSFGEALHVLTRTLPGKSDDTRPTKPSAERFSPGIYSPVA